MRLNRPLYFLSMSIIVLGVTAIISLLVAWASATVYQLTRPCADAICFAGLDQAIIGMVISVCVGLGSVIFVYKSAGLRSRYLGAILFAAPIVLTGCVVVLRLEQLFILLIGSVFSLIVGTFLPSARFMRPA
jgi:hypothetical protein